MEIDMGFCEDKIISRLEGVPAASGCIYDIGCCHLPTIGYLILPTLEYLAQVGLVSGAAEVVSPLDAG